MVRYVAAPLPPSPGEGLPPLPPMFGAELFCGGRVYSYRRGQLPEHLGGTPLYTQEQMWAYARTAVDGVKAEPSASVPLLGGER